VTGDLHGGRLALLAAKRSHPSPRWHCSWEFLIPRLLRGVCLRDLKQLLQAEVEESLPAQSGSRGMMLPSVGMAERRPPQGRPGRGLAAREGHETLARVKRGAAPQMEQS